MAASEVSAQSWGAVCASDAGWVCLAMALSRRVARFAANASHMSRGEGTRAAACFRSLSVRVCVCGFVSVPSVEARRGGLGVGFSVGVRDRLAWCC